MKIMVTGDRRYANERVVFDALVSYGPDSTLIVGDAKGADRVARGVARALGWPVVVKRAKWDEHGRAAGPIRNQEMIGLAPDVVVAFPLPGSKGTWDAVRRARKAGIPVVFG